MDLLILPDRPLNGAWQRALAEHGGPVARHASGRPWLVAPVPDPGLGLVVVEAGARRLAVTGHTRVDPDAARNALAGDDLDGFAQRLPGSFHLFASIDGVVRARGTLSTARQVFYRTVEGVAVAATAPTPLLPPGARLDPEALALRLLTPAPPWPLALRTLWTDVRQAAPGAWLELAAAGAPREIPWWTAPAADTPLDEGAELIRSALRESIDVRVGGRAVVSADLSGGLDSTCLSFLAAAATPGTLLTYHWSPEDRANDDSTWADRAAALLPGGRHRRVSAAAASADRFTTGALLSDPEGPPPWNGGRSHHAALSQAVRSQGARLHLVGIGGDELFGAVPAYLWSLFRRHPLTSLPTLRRSRLMNRWRLGPFLRELTDSRSFATWLGAQADGLTRPAPGISDFTFGWAPEPRLPAWVTPDAVATVGRLLRSAAADRPAPQAPDRYRHLILDCLQVSGRAVRQLNQGLARFGVDWEAPFLDDAVVRAALAVRVEDRMARGRYKPLLVAAMRGAVPDEVLARRSKGEFSAEAYGGLRRNRAALVEQCDDLRLARLGLVDPDRLRAALLSEGPETRHLIPFESTLSTETWLRSQHVYERFPMTRHHTERRPVSPA